MIRTDRFLTMRLAAIDIGSNTVHLIVVEPQTKGRIARLLSTSGFVGLGRIVARKGRISPAAVRIIEQALKIQLRLARQARTQAPLIAATEAIRRASNGKKVMETLSRKVGVPIHIISPEKEGELTFLGALPVLRPRGRQLLIDVGGGSTELSVAQGRRWLAGVSLSLGSGMLMASMTRDPLGPLEWAKLKVRIQTTLESHAPSSWAPVRAIATGGSARQFRKLLKLESEEDVVTYRQLEDVMRLLLNKPARKLARKYDVDERRIAVLPAAALILASILEHYRLTAFETTRLGLRDGMIQAYLDQGENWYQ